MEKSFEYYWNYVVVFAIGVAFTLFFVALTTDCIDLV